MAWLSGWTNRLEIKVNYTDKIGGSVTHFPVTLFLKAENAADIFTEIGANKQKIAITKADGTTELYAEIEVWDTGTPLGIIHTSKSDWVINADTSIFLYYDSAHADNTTYIGIVTGASPATNVWDSAAKMVHHLADATISTVTDSTSNSNDGTKLANNEPIEAAGQIGKGQDFDGTDDIINVGQAGTLDIANVFSISAWVEMDAEDTLSDVLSRGYWFSGWEFRFRDNGYLADPDKGQIQFCGGPDNIIDNIAGFDCENKLGWNHVAVTYDKIAEEMKFYLNGSWLQTFAEANAIEDRACDVLIGAGYSLAPAAYQHFDGVIDELRFSLITRSAAWLKGEFNSGNNSLLSYCFLLEGSSAGQSAVDATLQDLNYIAGSSAVQSTADVTIKSTQKIVGSSTGHSTAAAHLTRFDTQLVSGVGAVSGASGTLALLSEWNHIAGTVSGQSATSGNLFVKHWQIFSQYAIVPGEANARLDDPSKKYAQTFPVYYRHNVYKLELRLRRFGNPGNLHIAIRENAIRDIFVGSSTGQSSASAYLRTSNIRLAGTVSVQTATYGVLHWPNEIVGNAAGISEASGVLTRSTPRLTGSFSGQSEVSGVLAPGEYWPVGVLIAKTDFDTLGVDTEIEWVTIYLDHPGWVEETPGMYHPGENDEERKGRIYGIVLSCSGADATNYIEWRYGITEPTLDYGHYCYFDGVAWSKNLARDFLFIEYGYRGPLESAVSPVLFQTLYSGLNCSLTIQNYEPEVPFIGGEYETTLMGDTVYESNFPFLLFETEYAGEIAKRYLDDFYYRIHIYENPIDLGFISTGVRQPFWVWNAFFAEKTLESIDTEGALNLIGQEAPYNLQALEAREYMVEITKEGLPVYKAEITFGFEDPLSDIVVVITGTRAAVVFWRPESRIRETLEWNTAILRAHGGKEQRIKLRQIPKQLFRLQFVLGTNKISSQFDAALHRWQKRSWLIPVWTEYVIHSGALIADAISIDMDTRYADFRDDSYVMIWKSTLEYEIVAVESVDIDKLNLKVGVVNNYTESQYILPLKVGYMISKNMRQKFNSPASMVEALFTISDNNDVAGHISERTLDFAEADFANTGDGDVSDIDSAEGESTEVWVLTCKYPPGTPGQPAQGKFSVVGSISGEMDDAVPGVAYDNGKIAFTINAGEIDFIIGDNFQTLEVLTTPSYMFETHQEESDGLIDINDFETGVLKVRSDKEFNLLVQNHIFYNDEKESSWKLRQFLHWLNGRQRAVLIPTYRDDLIQVDSIGTGDTYFYIENVNLAMNMGANELRTYVGFYFPDKTLLIRRITAIAEIDETKEKISINTSLGKSVDPGDCEICFVDKCRLASDKVEIDWPFAHRNECRPNLVRVP